MTATLRVSDKLIDTTASRNALLAKVTTATVEATERVEAGDLLDLHAAAGIELRITPSIRPFWDQVVASTVEFSGSRLRNAAQ